MTLPKAGSDVGAGQFNGWQIVAHTHVCNCVRCAFGMTCLWVKIWNVSDRDRIEGLMYC